MSILAAIKTYLETYTGLVEDAPVWVNFLGTLPVQYSVEPLPGDRIVKTYLNDATLREFPFAFQSAESSADDLERMANNSFYETFAAWLDSQDKAGVYPTLAEGQKPLKIEAVTWGYLYSQGQSDTGNYQIVCKLTYEQAP